MRDWLRRLPWARIALGTFVFVVLVAVVPPLRNLVIKGTSNVILFAASPLAPGIEDFESLPGTTQVVAADGSLLTELDSGQRRDPIKVAQLPKHVTRAVLAAEDAHFYDHGGVDPSAVMRAFVRTTQGRTQGGSTITQQLAKVNYTGGSRTVFRKVRELLYATRLEDKYTKDELLERYLNQVYFGDGAYGIASASEMYFGVTPSKLSVAQAATLAGKIRSPEGLDPRAKPKAVIVRRDQVLRNMRKYHWLDTDGLNAARAEPLTVAAPIPPNAARAPHFVEFVKREAATLDALGASPEARRHAFVSGGFRVETTLDPKAFDATSASVGDRLGEPDDPSTSVVSVQPGDGAIKNFFDGLNFDRKFDVASLGHRQPGSAFKPFVYLAAIRQRIDPRSTLDSSSPMKLHSANSGSYTVRNYEGEGGGKTTIDDAMTHSINTVFAQLVLEVTPQSTVDTATKAGIREKIKPFPSVALGGLSRGVSPLEMAAAYATFAAKGVYAEPYGIKRIVDSRGRVVYQHQAKTTDAFAASEVGVLNSALIQVVKQGTGKGAAIDRPVAGKTGTTQNHGDAWFVGFVPQLATAVWVGHPEKTVPMLSVHGVKVSGGSFPASIFSDTMRGALKGIPVEPIFTTRPNDLALHFLDETTPTLPLPSSTTSTSIVTAVVVSPSTTAPFTQTPSTEPPETTTTTAPKKPTTTTTTAPSPSSTTTTTTKKGDTDTGASGSPATTTTAPPPSD